MPRDPGDSEFRVNSKAAGRMTAVANGSLSVCGAKETNSNQIAATNAATIAWVRETRAPKNQALATIDSDDNAVLVRVVGELFDQRLNPYFAKLAHYFENPASWNAALAEHRAIREAITARDPDAARVAMREHLARSQARFAQNFGAEASSTSRVRARSG